MQEPAKLMHSSLVNVHSGNYTTPRFKPPSNILKPLLLNRQPSPRPSTPDWKHPSKCAPASGNSFSIPKAQSHREYRSSNSNPSSSQTPDSSFCKLRFTPSRDGKRLPQLLPTKHVPNIRHRSRCKSMLEIKAMDSTLSNLVRKASENTEIHIKKKGSLGKIML
jgi:hypothetical protein